MNRLKGFQRFIPRVREIVLECWYEPELRALYEAVDDCLGTAEQQFTDLSNLLGWSHPALSTARLLLRRRRMKLDGTWPKEST